MGFDEDGKTDPLLGEVKLELGQTQEGTFEINGDQDLVLNGESVGQLEIKLSIECKEVQIAKPADDVTFDYVEKQIIAGKYDVQVTYDEYLQQAILDISYKADLVGKDYKMKEVIMDWDTQDTLALPTFQPNGKNKLLADELTLTDLPCPLISWKSAKGANLNSTAIEFERDEKYTLFDPVKLTLK